MLTQRQHFEKLRYTVHATHPAAAEFFGGFLSIIETQMLVIRPHKTDEKPGRSCCGTISRCLGDLMRPFRYEGDPEE